MIVKRTSEASLRGTRRLEACTLASGLAYLSILRGDLREEDEEKVLAIPRCHVKAANFLPPNGKSISRSLPAMVMALLPFLIGSRSQVSALHGFV